MILYFRLHKIIKVPRKSFDDLSLREVALMIEANSSISPDGNEYFAACALDDFLHEVELKREDLNFIKDIILKSIYIDMDGSKNKKVDSEFLLLFASKFKEMHEVQRKQISEASGESM